MNLGMPEMIFIFLMALILFGPKKLPEIGRQIGRALTEFKRASNEFKMQIEDEIRQLEYDEQQKKIATPQTIDAPTSSYAESAAAALVNTAPEHTVSHDSDLHNGELPPERGQAEAPPSSSHLAQGTDA